MKWKILYITVLFFCYTNVFGWQGVGKLKSKKVLVTDCTVKVDSFSLVPGTVKVVTVKDKKSIDFNICNNSIIIDERNCLSLMGEFIIVTYRTFDFDIEHTYVHMDSSLMVEKDILIYTDIPRHNKNDIIESKDINYTGAFARGFSVGNAQSLVLNSNFNLRLQGNIGDGIGIVASISDDNIPIQPEGNTHLIQEFDKVFIRLDKGKSNLVAGDFVLKSPQTHFVKYRKKLKGLKVATEIGIGKEEHISSGGSFAVAKGKFFRQILDTKEGNQGPYKLTGSGGQRFLIVLSGSERVYLDGKRLRRGLDDDYIIDYNRAEITFMPKRMIGRESRIIVEYEYRDQNYLRSVYQGNVQYQSPKIDAGFVFYNEQDSKNATGDIVLDSTDITLLTSIGDDLDKAFRSSIFEVSDTSVIANRITYASNPNVFPGDTDPYFLEYSTDKNRKLFFVSFSEVPENTGRYIIDTDNPVNGRVYKYVGPQKGKYEPISPITPPEKKQMMEFSTNIRPMTKMKMGAHISVSTKDINRFSKTGDYDNTGIAGRLDFSHQINLGRGWTFNTDNMWEKRGPHFSILDPYRNQEFLRDWDISQSISINGLGQSLLKMGFSVDRKDSLSLSYGYERFSLEEKYTGILHKGAAHITRKSFRVGGQINWLDTKGFGFSSRFVRPRVNLEKTFTIGSSPLIFSMQYLGENNQRKNTASAGLHKTSFSFDEVTTGVKYRLASALKVNFNWKVRSDYFPKEKILEKVLATNEISSNLHWEINPNHLLDLQLGLRDFEVIRHDIGPENISSKKSIGGKITHHVKLWNGLLVSGTTYLVNSGQEPKVEFFFERVDEGKGDYIYIGNEDSTLIASNFRYAPNLGTGNFIRISLVNNEFVTTNNQSITNSIRLEPKKYLIGKTSRWAKILSSISTLTSIKIQKKSKDQTGRGYDIFDFSDNDTTIISYRSSINNTLYINKGQPQWDFRVGWRKTGNIFTQISGPESRYFKEIYSNVRIRVGRTADLSFEWKKGLRGYNSTLFEDRNLDISYHQLAPKITIRPFRFLRFSGGYSFVSRAQRILDHESAYSHDITIEANWQKSGQLGWLSSLSYVYVNYNGAPNSTIEFDLLEGLKNGKNILWQTQITKKLTKTVDLNISYQGRKNGSAKVVHIARAQVKATF